MDITADVEHPVGIVQLLDAEDHEKARRIVREFLISERMASRLCDVVFPCLQLDVPVAGKGILVLGGFGMGKSHLISLVSALAQYPDLVSQANNQKVVADAKLIAGRFRVVRWCSSLEPNGDLRNVLVRWLAAHGVLHRNQGADFAGRAESMSLTDMMHSFQNIYHDQGLLMVVDELYNYLESLDDHAFMRAFAFLRDAVEASSIVPFRLLAGAQISIFDSPRYQRLAWQLEQQFVQLHLDADDVLCVVTSWAENKKREGWKTEDFERHLRHLLDITKDA